MRTRECRWRILTEFPISSGSMCSIGVSTWGVCWRVPGRGVTVRSWESPVDECVGRADAQWASLGNGIVAIQHQRGVSIYDIASKTILRDMEGAMAPLVRGNLLAYVRSEEG